MSKNKTIILTLIFFVSTHPFPSTADRVTLTLSHFDALWNSYDNANCTRFYLALYDGAGEDAPEIGRYCSRQTPPSVTTSVTIRNSFYDTTFLVLAF